MANLNTFRLALKQEIDKIDEAEKDLFVKTVRAAYMEIIRVWPVDTHFSNANHRINITGRKVVRVEPEEKNKPDQPGTLAGKAAAVHAAQLAKLDRLLAEDKRRNVVIGNAVSYAPDVGNRPGRGTSIYSRAAVHAREIAARDFETS